MRLQLESRFVGEVLVVKCSGRIVAGNEAQALRDQLSSATAKNGDIVLHLGMVTFIDSSGLGTLVRLMAHARSCGGDLKLCAVPGPIFKTLQMINLSTVLEIWPSEEEAIAASYQRRQAKEPDTLHRLRRIVCFEESADVLAYVKELLHHAGYSVLCAGLLPDAQILIKATRPNLIILGPRTAHVREKSTKELLGEIAPATPVLVLEEDFSTRDPAETGLELLEKISRLLPAM